MVVVVVVVRFSVVVVVYVVLCRASSTLYDEDDDECVEVFHSLTSTYIVSTYVVIYFFNWIFIPFKEVMNTTQWYWYYKCC